MSMLTGQRNQQRGTTTVEYALVVVFCVAILITAVLLLADPTGDLNEDSNGNYLPKIYNSVHVKIDKTDTVEDLRN
mgnify:CR=1 FL=1